MKLVVMLERGSRSVDSTLAPPGCNYRDGLVLGSRDGVLLLDLGEQ